MDSALGFVFGFGLLTVAIFIIYWCSLSLFVGWRFTVYPNHPINTETALRDFFPLTFTYPLILCLPTFLLKEKKKKTSPVIRLSTSIESDFSGVMQKVN